MVEIGTIYHERWRALGPFRGGRSQNFLFVEVEDLRVANRIALLKTPRKRDLPAPALLEARRQMLLAELTTAGALVHPALPEAIDTFALPDGEPAIVYALVGQGRDA